MGFGLGFRGTGVGGLHAARKVPLLLVFAQRFSLRHLRTLRFAFMIPKDAPIHVIAATCKRAFCGAVVIAAKARRYN